MIKESKNKQQIIKALSVGLSAAMVLQPVTALAADEVEETPVTDEIVTEVTDPSEEHKDTLEEAGEKIGEAKKELGEAEFAEGVASWTAVASYNFGIVADESEAIGDEFKAGEKLNEVENALAKANEVLDGKLEQINADIAKLDASTNDLSTETDLQNANEDAQDASEKNDSIVVGSTSEGVAAGLVTEIDGDKTEADEIATKVEGDALTTEEKLAVIQADYDAAISAFNEEVAKAAAILEKGIEKADDAVEKAEDALEKAKFYKSLMDKWLEDESEDLEDAKKAFRKANFELANAEKWLSDAKLRQTAAEETVYGTDTDELAGFSFVPFKGFVPQYVSVHHDGTQDIYNKALEAYEKAKGVLADANSNVEAKKQAIADLEQAKKDAWEAIGKAQRTLEEDIKAERVAEGEAEAAQNWFNWVKSWTEQPLAIEKAAKEYFEKVDEEAQAKKEILDSYNERLAGIDAEIDRAFFSGNMPEFLKLKDEIIRITIAKLNNGKDVEFDAKRNVYICDGHYYKSQDSANIWEKSVNIFEQIFTPAVEEYGYGLTEENLKDLEEGKDYVVIAETPATYTVVRYYGWYSWTENVSKEEYKETPEMFRKGMTEAKFDVHFISEIQNDLSEADKDALIDGLAESAYSLEKYEDKSLYQEALYTVTETDKVKTWSEYEKITPDDLEELITFLTKNPRCVLLDYYNHGIELYVDNGKVYYNKPVNHYYSVKTELEFDQYTSIKKYDYKVTKHTDVKESELGKYNNNHWNRTSFEWVKSQEEVRVYKYNVTLFKQEADEKIEDDGNGAAEGSTRGLINEYNGVKLAYNAAKTTRDNAEAYYNRIYLQNTYARNSFEFASANLEAKTTALENAKKAVEEAEKQVNLAKKEWEDEYQGSFKLEVKYVDGQWTYFGFIPGHWENVPVYEKSNFEKKMDAAVIELNAAVEEQKKAENAVKEARNAKNKAKKDNDEALAKLNMAKMEVFIATGNEIYRTNDLKVKAKDLTDARTAYNVALAADNYATGLEAQCQKAYNEALEALNALKAIELNPLTGNLSLATSNLEKSALQLKKLKTAATKARTLANEADEDYNDALRKLGIIRNLNRGGEENEEEEVIQLPPAQIIPVLNAPAAVGGGFVATVTPEEVVEEEIIEEEPVALAEAPEVEPEKEPEVVEIPEIKVPEVDFEEVQKGMSWWWLLIVAALGATGAGLYRKYSLKKREVEDTTK